MLNEKIEFDYERVEGFSKVQFMFHIDFCLAPMFLYFHMYSYRYNHATSYLNKSWKLKGN